MDESFMKRVLPHSVEAEQSVIGSMLMDKEAVIAASEILASTDFYHSQYGGSQQFGFRPGYCHYSAYICQH